MSRSNRLYHSPVVRSLVSGLALGAAFPPSPVSTLAFVAFLPWLTVFDEEATFGRMVRATYAMLAAYHLTTVYWTGGFVHGNDGWMMVAGVGLILFHPFFLLPFVMGAWGVRRILGRSWGLTAFVLMWTTFEFFHARGEFSFPWIAVGNSQASDILRIQFAEFFSVTGLTLHVLAFNALAYLALMEVAEGRWPRTKRVTFALWGSLMALYFIPLLYGWTRMDSVGDEEGSDREIRVSVIQPDIDPWEKWGKPSGTKWLIYEQQVAILDSLTRARSLDRPDLIVWPETATPFHLLLPSYRPYLDRVRRLAGDVGGVLLTGLPHARFFDASNAPVTARRIGDTDQYVESYNSATTISSDGTVGPVYCKVVLVPFAERLPHAETLRFLIEPLKWNVGISSWGMGTDTTVFSFRTRGGEEARFSAMVCYESVYPEYVRAFVQRGAEFLVVITNDSWWGNTSGTYQHAAYAAVRAVEFRRWVVQGANGGISLVVDPTGRTVRRSSMFERSSWTESIQPRREMTFYAHHGDVAGMLCVVLGGAIGGWTLIVGVRKRYSG